MSAKKKLSFEQAMDRLNEIVSLLENGDTTLADSMKLFEEGAKLSAQCYEELEQAEQKITLLTETED